MYCTNAACVHFDSLNKDLLNFIWWITYSIDDLPFEDICVCLFYSID